MNGDSFAELLKRRQMVRKPLDELVRWERTATGFSLSSGLRHPGCAAPPLP